MEGLIELRKMWKEERKAGDGPPGEDAVAVSDGEAVASAEGWG